MFFALRQYREYRRRPHHQNASTSNQRSDQNETGNFAGFLLLKRLPATFVVSRAKLVFEKNIARETSHPERRSLLAEFQKNKFHQ